MSNSPPERLPPPSLHEAECVPAGVQQGAELTEPKAVERRRRGEDIVVCGDDTKVNHAAAERVERQVANATPLFHGPHEESAEVPLPHWQQRSGSPAGHSFYETEVRKAVPAP